MNNHILIIEDEYINRLAFTKIVEDKGFTCRVAKNEFEAIDKLKNINFLLILLDLRMPPRGFDSGFEILKRKAKIKLNKDTKVIIITGALSEKLVQDRVQTYDHIEKILLKPVQNKEISKAVDDVLNDIRKVNDSKDMDKVDNSEAENRKSKEVSHEDPDKFLAKMV